MQKSVSIAETARLDPESVNTVNKEALVEISGFSFDYNLPQEERAALILAALKNPYSFRSGELGVKLEFAEQGPGLEELFCALLLRLKSSL